jgi:hypothetical protein
MYRLQQFTHLVAFYDPKGINDACNADASTLIKGNPSATRVLKILMT